MNPSFFIHPKRPWYHITLLFYFSPLLFFVCLFIFFFNLKALREKETDFFTSQLPTSGERFHQPASAWSVYVCVWGGVRICIYIGKSVCVFKNYLQDGAWAVCVRLCRCGIMWACVLMMISTCASSCVWWVRQGFSVLVQHHGSCLSSSLIKVLNVLQVLNVS